MGMSGCNHNSEGAAAARPEAAIPSGWKVYTAADKGFTVAAPADWTPIDMTTEETKRSAGTIIKGKPGDTVSRVVQYMSGQRMSSFLLVGKSDSKKNFLNYLSILELPVADNKSLDDHAHNYSAGLASTGARELSLEQVQIGGGDAIKIHSGVDKGSVKASVWSYLIPGKAGGNKEYALSVSLLEPEDPNTLKVAQQIVETFRPN